MALTISGSYAAPKPKPVSLASSVAPYYPSNTVGAAAASGGYAGIQSAFPSSVASTSIAPPAPSSSATLGTLSSVGTGNASDYSQQIADLVAPTARAVSAQGATNQANLSALRQQALARFGYIPANLSGQLTGDVNADINDTTRGLAAAGTAGGVSTYAQLQKAYNDQVKGDWANLAARNMVHSGAAGQHLNADLSEYQQNLSSKTQDLMDALQGYYQTKLAADATGQQSLADATDKALQQIIAQIQANMYQTAPTAAQQPSVGDYSGIVAPDYTGSSNPAVITSALNAPGAVAAMGGPAPWANALQTVTAPKKAAARPYQPLVGRDY